ncbi:hypothetical protein CZ771_00310 [Actinomycetales bacterium JB111]|nr:hypothetical protein CZ771_00310 [Actinomycetales bacterium JB111]
MSANKQPGRGGHAIATLIVAAIAAVPVTAALTGLALWLLWPGHLHLLPAEWICPPDHPTVAVTRETWQASDGGTAVDLAVFCQSPTGGLIRPGIWPIVWREAFAIWGILTALFWLPQLLRGPRRAAAPAHSPLTGSTKASEAARAMRLSLEHRAATEEAPRRKNGSSRTSSSANEGGTYRPSTTPRPTSTTSTTDEGGWASAPGDSLWRK